MVGAATENERRPIVERRCAGTCKDIVVDERSRRRPGKSATRTRSSKYGGANPCSTRYASTETLKYQVTYDGITISTPLELSLTSSAGTFIVAHPRLKL